MQWAVVVPVKRLERAKSRLDVESSGRAELALAMAGDVVAAALDCAAVDLVVVVTDDERAGAELAALGAHLAAEPPGVGLNPALLRGAEVARSLAPDLGLAVLAADLPALDPAELEQLLDAAAGHERWFVRDRDGSGTTALGCGPRVTLAPSFGPGSAAAHAGAGHTELPAALVVRHDVDSMTDLVDLLREAPGAAAPRTRRAAAAADLIPAGLGR